MSRKLLATLATGALVAGALVVGTASAGTAATTANIPCNHLGYVATATGSALVPFASNGSTNCYMTVGNTGGGVSALQAALIYCNDHAAIAADGVYGQQTKNAVWTFQSNRSRLDGLGVDGVYGVNTRNAMLWPTGVCESGWF